MKILYFAWLREKVGVPSEEKDFEAGTVIDLINYLVKIDEKYA